MSDATDWTLNDITERDVRVSDLILKIFNKWETEYNAALSDSSSEGSPSEEDLAKIEEYKKKGWV